MPWQIWTRIATLRYIWTIGIMVHISAPRTQVHLNILERLFTGDRKEECYIGPFCFFFHSTWELHFFCFISVFLNLFERTPTVNQDWVVSGSLSLRQSLQGNKQTRWFITHLDSGFSGWPKNSIFNGKWKLTIYKKRQRGRSSGSICTQMDPRLYGWPKSSFFTCNGVTSIFESLFVRKFL